MSNLGSVTYTYNKAILGGGNGVLNKGTLNQEIRASDVQYYEDIVPGNGSQFEIIFSQPIDSANELLVEGVLADHTGEESQITPALQAKRFAFIDELVATAIQKGERVKVEVNVSAGQAVIDGTLDYKEFISQKLDSWARYGIPAKQRLLNQITNDMASGPFVTLLGTIVTPQNDTYGDFFYNEVDEYSD